MQQNNKLKMLSRQEQNDIYNRYKYEIVRRLQFNYNKYDAEAIYDDAMLKVLTRYHQYRGEKESSFKSWIYTIVNREIINHMRANRSYTDNEYFIQFNNERGYEDTYHRIQDNDYIKKLLSIITNKLQSDLFNDFVTGYSYKDLSKKHNIKVGTAKWHVHECRRIINSKIKLASWQNK